MFYVFRNRLLVFHLWSTFVNCVINLELQLNYTERQNVLLIEEADAIIKTQSVTGMLITILQF